MEEKKELNILAVIDMQNDFVDGSLGTKEAQQIVASVVKEIRNPKYDYVLVTKDTHKQNYLKTREGKNLPVEHCIKGTAGWNINKDVQDALDSLSVPVETYEKPTFGSQLLAEKLMMLDENYDIKSVTFVGLCTDICVVSNVLIAKAILPEKDLMVVANCCAGVTPQTHQGALETMKMCQIEVI